ncbi:MAG TPA: hypothetical protein VK716_13110 [Terracidiphilus sp.]|jgi:hypothetical protein|nr:hypothetical protein [Terracidiphilus sp.]
MLLLGLIAAAQTSGPQIRDANTPGSGYLVAALVVAVLALMVAVFVHTFGRRR